MTIRNSSTSPGAPAPTRALELLPTIEAVRDAGIDGLTLDEARLVAVVLSIFISKGRAKTRSKVGIMIDLLVPSCRVEVIRDGKTQPAALPNLPTGPWPHGKTPFNQLGIDTGMIEAYWRTAKNCADDACLPLPWLLAFVPAPLWLAVLTLITWGPYEAGVRAEEAVTVLAETPIRQGNRRRPAGSLIAKGTLENRVDNLWALMQAICPLADHLTVADLADLYGRSPQAINAWCRDGFPRGRIYWDSTAWVVSGPRSKVLPVSAIDQTLLGEVQRERLRVIRQRRAFTGAA